MKPAIYRVECRCEACDHEITKTSRVHNLQSMREARYLFVMNTLLFPCKICGQYGLPIVSKKTSNTKWVKLKAGERE